MTCQPDYLAAELRSYQPQLSPRSSSQELLTVPHCKAVLDRRRFSVAAPRVWETKAGLKTYLFRQDYSQCHSAPQITMISLELWRFLNYVTYLLRSLILSL